MVELAAVVLDGEGVSDRGLTARDPGLIGDRWAGLSTMEFWHNSQKKGSKALRYFPGLLFRLRNITLSSLGRLSVDCVVHERVEDRRAEPERGRRHPEGYLWV